MRPSPQTLQSIESALLSSRNGQHVRLQGAQQIKFSCFEHDDPRPSAHWHPKKMVWICRVCPNTGGGVRDMARRLGLEFVDLDDVTPQPVPGQKPSATYTYTLNGKTYRKERYDFPEGGKTFKWVPKLSDVGVSVSELPLFWLEDPASRPDEPVVFVEGEKTAISCWEKGLLATCGAWGASQTNFGGALEELRGRDVWLAPDNDSPGRKYMQTVAAALKGVAKSVHWVRVPLPAKGDLYDFFADGGKPEAVFQGDLDHTAIEVLEAERVRVRVPSEIGIISFDAYDLSHSSRALDCWLDVRLEGPGQGTDVLTQRINLISSSARNQLRIDLSRMFETEKEFNWTRVLNEVANLVRVNYVNHDLSADVFLIPDESEKDQYLLGDILPLNQPTLFFGDGSSLKSYAALLAQVCVGIGMRFPGTPGEPDAGPTLYVDYENVGEQKFRLRVKRLLEGLGLEPVPGLMFYWPGRGIPLGMQAGAIEAKVRAEGIKLIVVDSVAPATGALEPEKAGPAMEFFNVLSRIGTTSLGIAHINRARDIYKPFGSAMWHNQARRTWYFQRAGMEGADRVDLGMYCRKVNDGPLPYPKALRVEFEGTLGPVTWQHASFREVDRSLDRLRPVNLRLRDALSRGPQRVPDLADIVGAKPETVRGWLKRWPDQFLETTMGWALRTAAS